MKRVFSAAFVMLAFSCREQSAPDPSPPSNLAEVRNVRREPPHYVPAEQCRSCHQEAWKQWKGSHHDLAYQPATPESVVARFEGRVSNDDGQTAFRRDGARFVIRGPGPDGAVQDFEVAATFGIEPLQQYLVQLPGGRLQPHNLAWDVERKRWFDVYPDTELLPGDPYHWTGRNQGWNAMCADCHSTQVERNYNPETDQYATTYADEDVGCQACHGPGSRHVAWAREPNSVRDKGLVVQTSTLAHRQVDQCAGCHARRGRLTVSSIPGAPFLDQYRPALLREGQYHADGQILDEVFVYGSYLQSKMYHAGVACSDCHGIHDLSVPAGNAACATCHNPSPPVERFPSLAAKARDYTSPRHHRHPAGSEGAACVNCHMVETNYMVVDGRRDHSFRVPRPDLTEAIGTPNACSTCHTDRSAAWAASRVQDWFGDRPSHYGSVLAKARRGTVSLTSLAQLAASPKAPGIVRATAVEHLAAMGPRAWGALNPLTEDLDPLVRASAVLGLRGMPEEPLARVAQHLLKDPVRLVRHDAARTLASARKHLSPSLRTELDDILEEMEATSRSESDLATGALSLGLLMEAQDRHDEARAAYLRALRLDPKLRPASFNLGNLLNARGENEKAEAVFRAAIAHAPHDGELRYSLGLLLAEMEQWNEAVKELQSATRQMPERPRVRYNYALALERSGDPKRLAASERELLRVHEMRPDDPDYVFALVSHYARRKAWSQALPYAQKLVELVPGAPGPRAMLNDLQLRAGRTD
ncbi:MAG: tetratricopeptide repeat protein [Myxococcota bacterium]